MNDDQRIADFWDWFCANRVVLGQAYDKDETGRLDELISARVGALASCFGWEMGPYALPDHSFVISPGNREHIGTCRAVVDAAPSVPGWRFFAGKPAKDLLELKIRIEGEEVCADGWRYRATSFDRGQFVDVEIFYEVADAPLPEQADLACELLVESLLGELTSLERVGFIEHSCVEDVCRIERTTPLRFLGAHLRDMLTPVH